MELRGYENIDVEGYKTSLVVVKSANDLVYIWFEDVRDIDHFKTTGYVIRRSEGGNAQIFPVNKNGKIPKDINSVLKQLTNPAWERKV